MRVLIVNTSENTGGAAVAANRIMEALNNNGVKAKMLVRDKVTDDLTVVEAGGGLLGKWNFLWERWCIFCHTGFSRKHLFDIDIANAGTDITKTREFKEADVIHLNWVNQGMLSLGGISKILASGKPVVWTMHDMWPATALCHLTFGCRKYATTGCSQCPLLPRSGVMGDLAKSVWKRKMRMVKRFNRVFFVACSRWLAGEGFADSPLHFSRFFPSYRMTGVPPTPTETLISARDIARRCGISYVYIGNVSLPGAEDTRCPRCGATLIRRSGYRVSAAGFNGSCPECRREISGKWK